MSQAVSPASRKARLLKQLSELLLLAVTFTYYKSFKRNTLDAIEHIILLEDSSPELPVYIKRFAKSKALEAAYVQVAGAIVFASVVSALSWNNIATSHWSAQALLYSSIVFALAAVVLGAQQTMVLPDKDDDNYDSVEIRKALIEHNNGLKFALQCPMMVFSFSITTFLAGLWSVVFSPLGMGNRRDGDVKTAILFGCANLLALIVFLGCSNRIHQFPMPSLTGSKMQISSTTQRLAAKSSLGSLTA